MKLRSFLRCLAKGKSLLVFTHNNPDPDAIASALILEAIAASRKIKTRTVYGGHLTRAENKTMVEELSIPLFPFDEEKDTGYELTAIVDCQKESTNNSFPNDKTPDFTFDHHNTRKKYSTFCDIQPDMGATASILLKYYLKLELPVSTQIATAYCYALISETRDLDRGATQTENRLFNRIYPQADQIILSRIRHAKKPLAFYETLRAALSDYQITGNLISCYLGTVPSPDHISEIADILLGIMGIDFSLIMGTYNRQNFVSTRTSLKNIDMSFILKRALADRGKSGGHDMIAAGQFTGTPEALRKNFLNLLKKRKKLSPSKQ